MKKILTVFLAVWMILVLTACGAADEESSSDSTPTPDLSGYDIVGEWSDGKLMVHKTEGSFDYVEGSFGYIDANGNLLGEWHSDRDWIYPAAFHEDRALVYLGDDVWGTSKYLCDHGYNQKAFYALIDETGAERLRFVASLEYQPILNVMQIPDEKRLFVNRDIHEFEKNGYLFFKLKGCTSYTDYDNTGTWTQTFLLMPDEESFYRLVHFECYTKNKRMMLEYERECFGKAYANGYLTYQARFKSSGALVEVFLLFDQDGKIALDVSGHMGDYSVLSISDVRPDQTLSVTFIGVDKNHYTVDMDLSGKWISEPEKVG